MDIHSYIHTKHWKLRFFWCTVDVRVIVHSKYTNAIHYKAMSLTNGNWQSQHALFIKIMQFFGPSASIYCPGAARIRSNATIFCSSSSIFSSDIWTFCPEAVIFVQLLAFFIQPQQFLTHNLQISEDFKWRI